MIYKQESENDSLSIEPVLLNARQTALALGLSERQIFHLLKQGELPPRKVGNRLLYSVEMLRAFANGESVERWKKTSG